MKRDEELEALWGDSWEKARPHLRALNSVGAPAGLKHRIMNREFGRPGLLRRRFAQVSGAAVAAALCAILVLRTHQAAPPIDDLTDNDVITIAELFDSDATVSDLSFDLLDDEIDLLQEDV